MAAVEPYSPCPCGSGQKFKWCCHKVEAQADRAQRLFENGQTEAALSAIEDGLRKEPGNAWLLTRRAYYQLRSNQLEPAKESLRLVLQKSPRHVGAILLLTRLVLETEGPVAGIMQLQHALTILPPGERRALAALAQLMGAVLARLGFGPAAIAHLNLFARLRGDDEGDAASTVRAVESNPAISLWLKDPETLSPPPDSLSGTARERFEEALRWAGEGLWASAASAFEVLSGDQVARREADRNLGLCRLWLADPGGAAEALRRSLAGLGTSAEAVDLEALCQQITPVTGEDQVEQVQLIWPLRNRDLLIAALNADAAVLNDEPGPIDPDDPESPEVDQFALLDRAALNQTEGLRPEDIPQLVGRVLVGQEIVALETYDDGRLDRLVDRFTSIGHGAITPAHPKTKVRDQVARTSLALSWEWRLPEGLDPEEATRLDRAQGARVLAEVWPRTPMPFLKGRTPLEAAKAGDAVVPLRAAIMQLEHSRAAWTDRVDFGGLRASLGLEPEPPVDPETVDIDRLRLPRLRLVPADRLDDDRLAALNRRARRYMLPDVLERTSRLLVDRPHLWERAGVDSFSLFSDLALLVVGDGDAEESFDFIRRGRQADPAASRAANAPLWDMVEIRIRARTSRPEVWVPELALILERYDDPTSNNAIMENLIDMGLARLAPHPERAGDYLLDTRPLQTLLVEYGPRVTTASGKLGVAATKGELWTPGGPSGAGGGIWTPGSETSPPPRGESKPKLIIPGR